MSRFSIGHSLHLGLIALAIVLALIAALGIGRLYSARQRYDDRLVASSQTAVAGAQLAAAGVVEQATLAELRGRASAVAARAARRAYGRAAAQALRAAAGDPASVILVRAQIALQPRIRTAMLASGHSAGRSAAVAQLEALRRRVSALASALARRQLARQAQARSGARSQSRRTLLVIGLAGLLALAAALALSAALVGAMRRPLAALVQASSALAAGEVEQRVELVGPSELRELGQAFNRMAESLALAGRRLEAERERLELIVESLGDGLLVTEARVVTAANPRARELLPELPVGASVEDEDSPLPPLEQAWKEEVVVEHHGRSLAITAAPLGVLGTGDPHPGAGPAREVGADEAETPGAVWTVRDTTERVRLERAKSEFVATASHELRSPLTSIKGFVELLDRSSENLSPRQREFVEIVLRSTDRLVELVGDLLDMARIDADRVELDRRPIDVSETVREVSALMGPRFEQKRQQLVVSVAPTVPPALADASRVRQILANLLTNAHLYTPEGGTISVSAEPDRAWLQISVADTGVGMTPAELERIFERFYRAPARETSVPGTGLGLPIVKSLVELHRGQIEVESTPGAGTTFRVRLPVALPGGDSWRALEAVRGRRVLIVDDEPEVAELIQGQLAPLEVETEVAGDGETAIERLRAGRFDAMTLDVLMPAMDGFEVLRRLRSDPVLRRTPIVFVSVFANRQELAGEWTVSKPIDADELRAVLAAAVQSGRSRVLVVGREELVRELGPALEDLGIDHRWETNAAAAARACREMRFELALLDAGVRNLEAVLGALELRGRRLRQAVILFGKPSAAGVRAEALGLQVVPAEQAASALLAALRDGRHEDAEAV